MFRALFYVWFRYRVRDHGRFWAAPPQPDVQAVLLHLVPLSRRHCRELDAANVAASATGVHLLRVVHALDVDVVALLAGELSQTDFALKLVLVGNVDYPHVIVQADANLE